MRPIIKPSSAEKVFRYFFGDEWEKYEAIELAIRNGANKINMFDDELYAANRRRKSFKTFNWNADPSAFRIGGEAIAILRTGVHFYTMSYHHIGDNAKRYVALRPATPGAAVPVWRTDARGKLYISTGYALNQHAGGDRTTGSRGCQTAPRSQYGEFITFIGDALGVVIPLGIQRRAEKRFYDGFGKIPYVLVTQAQFNYIQNLPESEFDSPEDLRYQMANFVNIPKVPREKPELATNPNAVTVIQDLEKEQEIENAVDIPTAETGDGAGGKLPPLSDPMPPGSSTPMSVSETTTEKTDTPTGEVEKTVSTTTEIFNPTNIPAFIPRLGKQWMLGLIPGAGFLSTIYGYFANLPQWVIILLAVVACIALWKFFELLIKHREKVIEFITECYKKTADPTQNNLIPTNAAEFVGQRKNALLSSLSGAPTENK